MINKKYILNQHLLCRKSKDTLMLFNEESSEIYELNSVSADIFSYLQEGKPLASLLDWLKNNYEANDYMEEHVINILERFASYNIITFVEEQL